MVTLKLKELSQRLDKSISDMARDTGINRNTITALYHNKVDGIKFDTLARICKRYGVGLLDILNFRDPELKLDQDAPVHYRQEGEMTPFTTWSIWKVISDYKHDIRGIKYGFGEVYGYFKLDYGYAFWRTMEISKLARAIYENFGMTKKSTDDFFLSYLGHAQVIEKIYQESTPSIVSAMSDRQLVEFLGKVDYSFIKFWESSLFIDCFDAGTDQQAMTELRGNYHFSADEVGVLTTPSVMTFNNERMFALLNLVMKIRDKFKIRNISELKEKMDIVRSDLQSYIANYDYFKSNYLLIKHIVIPELVDEIGGYLSNDSKLMKEYKKLSSYSTDQEKSIIAVLKKHKLKDNPFYFFNVLTYWREHRKKFNLMGIHVLDMILSSLEAKTGIPKKYLRYLGFDEVEPVLKGLVDRDNLKKRHDQGMLLHFFENGHKIIFGDEAASLKADMDMGSSGPEAGVTELRGQTASQGYARGIARIILEQKDFGKLKKGEILVTSMTRPEFVPIMETAGAIVTNEGGITCHAAIVSRELGKPCIIGTRNATSVIKDGDLVEVRANHGTVKILKQ